jgi:small subunit ribosomal protein S5
MANNARQEKGSDLIEKVIHVGRVTKVVKGGRKMSFSALVVVGDQKGKVGLGLGKASEVADARSKAIQAAKKNMFKVPLRDGRTLHRDMNSKYGAGHMILRAAPSGTGIIAGGPVRALFEALGIKDIVAKSLGSSNPHNMVKAAVAALKSTPSPRDIAEKRGKKIGEIVGRRSGKNNKEHAA